VGQEIRDRFTGAVEAFARRNSSLGRQGDHSRHKSLADSFGKSNEAVSPAFSCESKYRNHRKDKPINYYVSSFLCTNFDDGTKKLYLTSPIGLPVQKRHASCPGPGARRRWLPLHPAQRLHHSGGVENSDRSSPHSPVAWNAPSPGSGSVSRDNTTFRSLERLSISTSRRK
jgi:casein kinase 1, epsilon